VIGSSHQPRGHAILVEQFPVYPSLDSRCLVTVNGPAHNEVLKAYSEGGFLRGAVMRLKMIDGWLYACGGGRSLGKRLDDDNWQSLTYTGDIDSKEKDSDRGFDDFDGFSESDIYAAGGRGDVWHFDGTDWKQLPFPSKMEITTVTCGGDGLVYISGGKGELWAGREDRWEQIQGPELEHSFTETVWYEDRLWAANHDGLWTVENKTVTDADVPDDVKRECTGYLSAGDGVLLTAGPGGAAFLEDGQWTTIVLIHELDRQFVEPKVESDPNWY